MADEKGSLLYILAPIGVMVVLLIAAYFLYQTYFVQTPQPIQNPTNSSQTYSNSQYGFSLDMPTSWNGYSVMMQTWEGRTIATGNVTETGPEIILRNPNWTQAQPYQDVPVMVFTKNQWDLVTQEKISLGAAPIGPSKLGENSNYVFALPARWVGFTDAQGQSEAQQITTTFKAF